MLGERKERRTIALGPVSDHLAVGPVDLGPSLRQPSVRGGFLRGGALPPIHQVMSYIDEHKGRFGVEPICRELQVAPSTYYETKRRPPSARAIRDDELKAEISQVHAANHSVYGARKVRRQLLRQKVTVARCTVERLMREMGLQGMRRGKRRR